LLCFLGVIPIAHAEPGAPATTPDPPPRRSPPAVGTAGFPTSSDLDGLYFWVGPSGAAGFLDDTWDSAFGADLAIVRVRERQTLSAIGGTAGASLWTARGGGRIWVDAVIGTKLGSRIYGLTAGPILELSELAHPRPGGSIGVWAFAGVTPFVRVGVVDELGMFAELGLHIALPVIRR
jgi:hypothetical protein